MIVLALDTTGPNCSVCLSDGDRILAHVSERIGRGHAERLAPMVADMFAESGLSPEAVDRVAVCTGPGSFTGLRVALSLAKGFALPRRLPVVGIDALAATYLASKIEPAFATVWTDVKRGQVMFGDYAGPGPLSDAHPVTGTQSDLHAHTALMQYETIEARPVDVRTVARAVSQMISDHLAHYPAIPLYARPPDAKLPGGKTLQTL